jgi:hypothetical protein
LERWQNRDPLGELGFELVRQLNNLKKNFGPDFAEYSKQGPNLFEFCSNNSITKGDIWGLLGLGLKWCDHANDVDLQTCICCAANNNMIRRVGGAIDVGINAAGGSWREYGDPSGAVGIIEFNHILSELDSYDRINILKGLYAKALLKCVHNHPGENALQQAQAEFKIAYPN